MSILLCGQRHPNSPCHIFELPRRVLPLSFGDGTREACGWIKSTHLCRWRRPFSSPVVQRRQPCTPESVNRAVRQRVRGRREKAALGDREARRVSCLSRTAGCVRTRVSAGFGIGSGAKGTFLVFTHGLRCRTVPTFSSSASSLAPGRRLWPVLRSGLGPGPAAGAPAPPHILSTPSV